MLPLVRKYLLRCSTPNKKILCKLATNGYFNLLDGDHESPLHWILGNEECRVFRTEELVATIVANSQKTALVDNDGNNILHVGVRKGLESGIVGAILKGQIKPSPLVTARNGQGQTPMRVLSQYVTSYNAEALKMLVEFGGNINDDSDPERSPLAIYLYANGRRSQVEEWETIKHVTSIYTNLGANVDAEDKTLNLPLEIAMVQKIPLDYLIHLMPSANAKQSDEEVALH